MFWLRDHSKIAKKIRCKIKFFFQNTCIFSNAFEANEWTIESFRSIWLKRRKLIKTTKPAQKPNSNWSLEKFTKKLFIYDWNSTIYQRYYNEIYKIHVIRYDFEIWPLKTSSYWYNLQYFREKIILSDSKYLGEFFCQNYFEIKKL